MTTPISLLGCTGTIGIQTLDVVRRHPDEFRITALSCGENVDALAEQIREFSPQLVSVGSEAARKKLLERVPSVREIMIGDEGLVAAATHRDVRVVVAGVSGFRGLLPVLRAIEAGKDVALANKESLVAGGHLVRAALEGSRARLVPVDSEHSSIFQLLGGRSDELRRIVLTASGGPFLQRDLRTFESITPDEAVKHPRWNMGAKISVDSATLMNKGLEVIEAAWLFDLPVEQIGVLIHPESIVHGFVEFQDGAQIACLFSPDMRLPISFALGYLRGAAGEQPTNCRISDNGVPAVDLARAGTLHFSAPDRERFPALELCYDAMRSREGRIGGGRRGEGVTALLNGANEVAVARFLARELSFPGIVQVLQKVMERSAREQMPTFETLEGITEWDALGRRWASEIQ